MQVDVRAICVDGRAQLLFSSLDEVHVQCLICGEVAKMKKYTEHGEIPTYQTDWQYPCLKGAHHFRVSTVKVLPNEPIYGKITT